ncbi:MAG TPA: DUF3280 domain-containing protein [Gammaproteobacteria bacterium]|nr:DUF3280 domain-containing protein [Gammaproteobacteria bacterium]
MKYFNAAVNALSCMALGLVIAWCPPADAADTRIAVLDFELRDLTPMPRTPEELERTASVAPLLRDALAARGGYTLVDIDPQDQAEANASVGYLFEHPENAAELGRQYGADWIAVGRVHKPSFLFAYMIVQLVNADTRRIAGEYVVEVKGSMEQATRRGAAGLAEQIDETIQSAVRHLHSPSSASPPAGSLPASLR